MLPQACSTETEALRAETQELQAKLRALRMVPGAALAEASGCAFQPLSPSAAAENSAVDDGSAAAAVHFSLADDKQEAQDLEQTDMHDMYDFSRFIPAGAATDVPAVRPAAEACEVERRRAEQRAERKRLEASEATLRTRTEALELQMEAQERKLTSASRQVAKTRNEVKKLTAQVGLKDLQGSKNSKEVASLRQALVEREDQLQDALDECDKALASTYVDEDAQSPQEGAACGPAKAAMSAEDEESLVQLMRVAEELTHALETAQAGEEDAMRQLAFASSELEREEVLTEETRLKVLAAREAREAEVAALLARIKEQEQALAAERERTRSLQAGPESKTRDTEPEGEPAGRDALEPLSNVDITDPEVAAAEKAARAALEAMRLHGTQSAAKAGQEASKVAGHLSNVARGGLLLNLRSQVRSALAATRAPTDQPCTPPEKEESTTGTPGRPLDWNYDLIEV